MFERTLLFATLLAVAAGGAQADTVLHLKSHQDAFAIQGQEQPARDNDVELWIGPDAIARTEGQKSFIMHGDQLLLVDHDAKTYSVLDLPIDLHALAPAGQQEMVDQMTQMMKMTADVTPTDETREVGSWDTKLVKVKLTNPMGLEVSMDLWTSDDVEVPMGRIYDLMRAMSEMQPGGADWIDQLSKVKGYPVLRETTLTVMGQKVATREELVSVEQKDAPAGTYAAPEGYERQDFNPMEKAGAGH